MREKFTDQRQRLAGISQLEAHQHHQAKAEEQERETAQTVLNADHFVVGGKNIFSPPPELVVLVFASVCVWIVMRFDRSRGIHFRRKLSFQYLEGSPVCKAEKRFRGPKRRAPGPSRTGIIGTEGSHLPWCNLNMSILRLAEIGISGANHRYSTTST